MGGIGKTYIGLSSCPPAARRESLHGWHCCDYYCHHLDNASDVLSRILARFHPQRRQLEVVDRAHLGDLAQSLLKGKNALIVLDNVEPTLDVAAVVAPLREVGVTVLMTARHILPRAAVPADSSRIMNLLSVDEALELSRSLLATPAVSDLAETESQAAQQIILALDCHTLAVKLAGAYAADLNRDLVTLAEELENPAHAIELPDGETPRGVALAFARSTDNLDPSAKTLFSSLAAFGTGEIGRNAALALAEALGLGSPRMCLDILVLRALVIAYSDGAMPNKSDRERLRLHPLMRAFAAQEFSHEEDSVQERGLEAVAHYYSGYVYRCAPASLSHDEANIKIALEWAYRVGRTELIAALVMGMQPFWMERWRTDESTTTCLGACQQQKSAPIRTIPPISSGWPIYVLLMARYWNASRA